MVDYVMGIDCSKWQGEMNWEKCAQAGAKFAFIRAGSIDNSSGVCYTDYQFYRNASFAPEHLPAGYYFYFRPNYDATKQADYFCDLIENEDWLLPPVLDLETTGNRTAAQITNSAVAFIARVYERLTVWPIVYSRASFMNSYTQPRPLWKECDLWIARYKSTLTHPWGDAAQYPSLKPRDWDDWKFWQYIAESNAAVQYGGEGPPGGDDDIDLNYFNGDQAAFDEYIHKPQLPPVLPADIGVKIDIDGVKYWGRINKVE